LFLFGLTFPSYVACFLHSEIRVALCILKNVRPLFISVYLITAVLHLHPLDVQRRHNYTNVRTVLQIAQHATPRYTYRHACTVCRLCRSHFKRSDGRDLSMASA
jgi:hypothetical protein